ncbi:MAG: hypothetical protein AB1656_06020 [Candidatus Omnitrophota bacterium]
MIAPRDNEHTLRLLSLGLSSQEKTLVESVAARIGGALHCAKDDMDLWGFARTGRFDLCILAQNEEIHDPSYLIWLLKGLASHSRIILIYSSIAQEEANRLKRYDAPHVLVRPVDAAHLAQAIDAAMNAREEKREGFWARLIRLPGSRKSSKVH